MNRYRLSAGLAALLAASSGAAAQDRTQTADKAKLKVAFVVSEQFNIIDFAGPWEVFNDAKLPVEGKQRGDWPSLFENYTVSDSTAPVRTGGNHATLVPSFTFRNAPKPDIIVVGAQDSNTPEFFEWLRNQNASGATGYVGVHRRGQVGSRRSPGREIRNHSPCISERLQRWIS